MLMPVGLLTLINCIETCLESQSYIEFEQKPWQLCSRQYLRVAICWWDSETTLQLFSEKRFSRILFSGPESLPVIINQHFSFRDLFSSLIWSRYGKIIFSKNPMDLLVFDQLFSVMQTDNELGNLHFGKQ